MRSKPKPVMKAHTIYALIGFNGKETRAETSLSLEASEAQEKVWNEEGWETRISVVLFFTVEEEES